MQTRINVTGCISIWNGNKLPPLSSPGYNFTFTDIQQTEKGRLCIRWKFPQERFFHAKYQTLKTHYKICTFSLSSLLYAQVKLFMSTRNFWKEKRIFMKHIFRSSTVFFLVWKLLQKKKMEKKSRKRHKITTLKYCIRNAKN